MELLMEEVSAPDTIINTAHIDKTSGTVNLTPSTTTSKSTTQIQNFEYVERPVVLIEPSSDD
jgi:hypothetical protein